MWISIPELRFHEMFEGFLQIAFRVRPVMLMCAQSSFLSLHIIDFVVWFVQDSDLQGGRTRNKIEDVIKKSQL